MCGIFGMPINKLEVPQKRGLVLRVIIRVHCLSSLLQASLNYSALLITSVFSVEWIKSGHTGPGYLDSLSLYFQYSLWEKFWAKGDLSLQWAVPLWGKGDIGEIKLFLLSPMHLFLEFCSSNVLEFL